MKEIVYGSGNIFRDAGFEDADEMQARAQLVYHIDSAIKQHGLKQREAAALLGLKQPDVSALMNGRFVDFSLDRLLALLVRLNKDVEIVVKPAPDAGGGGLHVSAW